MSITDTTAAPVRNTDRFFIGGEWVEPSTDAMIDVIDSGTEELFFRVAEAQADDMSRAVAAARQAFDEGPWPRMTHAERAVFLRALGAALQARTGDLGQAWTRESGTLFALTQYSGMMASMAFESYAALADTFPFEERAQPTYGGDFGLLVREPVGVVGAIIPWNAPHPAHLPQDRSRAARGLQHHSQVVARSSRRGLSRRRSRARRSGCRPACSTC